jgi:hypothetical protein
MQASVNLKEDLLNEILEIVCGRGQPEHQARHVIAMLSEQLPKCDRVTRAASLQKLSLRVHRD